MQPQDEAQPVLASPRDRPAALPAGVPTLTLQQAGTACADGVAWAPPQRWDPVTTAPGAAG